jgi:hypothetical protein
MLIVAGVGVAEKVVSAAEREKVPPNGEEFPLATSVTIP